MSRIITSTKAATRILVIDGCPLEGTRKTLETAGFTKFEHLRLADMGMGKGKSFVSHERIANVAKLGKTLLTN